MKVKSEGDIMTALTHESGSKGFGELAGRDGGGRGETLIRLKIKNTPHPTVHQNRGHERQFLF